MNWDIPIAIASCVIAACAVYAVPSMLRSMRQLRIEPVRKDVNALMSDTCWRFKKRGR